jgi:predicted GIY-YIG superfamily endonuclease
VTYCVYAIIDPRSDQIVYIGQTSRFEARKAEHTGGTDQLSGLVIRQLKLNGFVPLFVILETCRSEAQSLSSEIFWIELCRARGIKLLNAQAVGGYAGRRAKGNALSAALDVMSKAKHGAVPLRDIANGCSVRRGRDWSAVEIKRLKGMVRSKMSIEAMADALERTPSEVRRKSKTLRR